MHAAANSNDPNSLLALLSLFELKIHFTCSFLSVFIYHIKTLKYFIYQLFECLYIYISYEATDLNSEIK